MTNSIFFNYGTQIKKNNKKCDRDRIGLRGRCIHSIQSFTLATGTIDKIPVQFRGSEGQQEVREICSR
jgi:hypothetical protein